MALSRCQFNRWLARDIHKDLDIDPVAWTQLASRSFIAKVFHSFEERPRSKVIGVEKESLHKEAKL